MSESRGGAGGWFGWELGVGLMMAAGYVIGRRATLSTEPAPVAAGEALGEAWVVFVMAASAASLGAILWRYMARRYAVVRRDRPAADTTPTATPAGLPVGVPAGAVPVSLGMMMQMAAQQAQARQAQAVAQMMGQGGAEPGESQGCGDPNCLACSPKGALHAAQSRGAPTFSPLADLSDARLDEVGEGARLVMRYPVEDGYVEVYMSKLSPN